MHTTRIRKASASSTGRMPTRPSWRWSGRVVEANAQIVEAEGPMCSVGECCEIVDGAGLHHHAEVIGFRGRHVLAMPLEATQGIRYGDAVRAMGATPSIGVGEEMPGRILNALGERLRPFDSRERLDPEIRKGNIRELLPSTLLPTQADGAARSEFERAAR